jgi:uncharacterized protein (TIGR00730 family)
LVVVASSEEIASPAQLAVSRRLGRLLAENGITVVTDGSALGTSGTVASAALESGGRAIGVDLESTPTDRVHPGLTERRTVGSEPDREKELGRLADAVLGLPGGFADLEAAFAVWSWPDREAANELPLGLVDEGGYYSDLLKSAADPAVDRFVRESQRGLLVVSNRPEDVLRRLADFRPPETRRGEVADVER